MNSNGVASISMVKWLCIGQRYSIKIAIAVRIFRILGLVNMSQETIDWQANYRGHPIKIGKRQIGKTEVYYVSSSPEKKPLVLTRALKSGGKEFWTSIPQGMQKEAEEIGAIIDKLEK